MRLVKAKRETDEGLPGDRVATAYDFRLYDDHGEPMRYVKSVSLKVDPSESHVATMVIQRYVMKDDEIDIDLADRQVWIEDIPPARTDLGALDLRDTTTEKQFMQRLRAEGVPVTECVPLTGLRETDGEARDSEA